MKEDKMENIDRAKAIAAASQPLEEPLQPQKPSELHQALIVLGQHLQDTYHHAVELIEGLGIPLPPLEYGTHESPSQVLDHRIQLIKNLTQVTTHIQDYLCVLREELKRI